MIFCVIVTAFLAGLMGGFHMALVKSNGDDSGSGSSSGSGSVNMPLEGSPANINHRM